jgi:hypothetical protein
MKYVVHSGKAAWRDRVDVGEVDREDRVGLRGQ